MSYLPRSIVDRWRTCGLALAVLIWTPAPAAGETAGPAVVWQRSFGAGGWEEAHLARRAAGGYVAAGLAADAPGPAVQTLWIRRLGPTGKLISRRGLRVSDEEHQARLVRPAGDGGYIVAGDGGLSLSGQTSAVWLLKVDRAGRRLWRRTLAGMGSRYFGALAPIRGGGFLLASWRRPGRAGAASLDVHRLGADGKEIWSRSFADWGGAPAAIMPTGDGGVLIGGGAASHPAADRRGHSWLIKLAADGSREWDIVRRPLGAADTVVALAETPDGGSVVAGKIRRHASRNAEAWLLRLTRDGGQLWQRDFTAPGAERTVEIVHPTRDGGFLLAGEQTFAGPERRQVWLARLAADGTVRWRRFLGGVGDQGVLALRRLPRGAILLAGWSARRGVGSTASWLVRLGGR